MPELHLYQVLAVQDVIRAFEEVQSAMLQMPTGTGKTTVFCEIIKQNKATNTKTLVLVHTRELVDQIKKRLSEFGFKAGIILAGEKLSLESQVQVASIQTLTRKDINDWPVNVSLIVIDEAHHAKANTYQLIVNHYKDKILKPKILGVTATPCRTDKSGFRGTFETLIQSLPVKQFIEEGWLAGFKHMATKCPELTHVKINKITNDYDEGELATIMSEPTIMSDIIESYKKHGNNKKSIVFAVNRAHSKLIVERFNNEGIVADFIDGETNKTERTNKILQFKNGEIQVLCNVQVFTEGFDCPNISVVQLARPTKSLVLYLQMVGRGLRKKDDGSQALILDNAGLWKRHGLVTKMHKWSLEGVEKEASTIAVRDSDTGEVTEQLPENIIEVKGLEMEELTEVKEKELTHNDFVLKFKVSEKGKRQTNIVNGRKLENTYEISEIINGIITSYLFDYFINEVFKIVKILYSFTEPHLELSFDQIPLKIKNLTRENIQKCKAGGRGSKEYKLLAAEIIHKILAFQDVKNDTLFIELKKLVKERELNHTSLKIEKNIIEEKASKGTYLAAFKAANKLAKESGTKINFNNFIANLLEENKT